MTIEDATAQIIALNVEERCGWESAAFQVIGKTKLTREELVACAARFMAREAQLEHRRSFDVTPDTTTVPDVEALLAPTLDKLAAMASPLMILIGKKRFIEFTEEDLARWFDTRSAFANTVKDKHKAEEQLFTRTLELMAAQDADMIQDLNASAKAEVESLARKALVE